MGPLLRITGWKPGLRKVSMTKVLRRSAGLDLAAAKRLTDRVLDGEVVELRFRDGDAARKCAVELEALGAIAEVVDRTIR
jgi:ribosomal protein L7/L12